MSIRVTFTILLSLALVALLFFSGTQQKPEQGRIHQERLVVRTSELYDALLALDKSPANGDTPKSTLSCLEIKSRTLIKRSPVPELLHVVGIQNNCSEIIKITELRTGDESAAMESRPATLILMGPDQSWRFAEAVLTERLFDPAGEECQEFTWSSSLSLRNKCRDFPLPKSREMLFTVTAGGYYALSGHTITENGSAAAPVSIEGRRARATLEYIVHLGQLSDAATASDRRVCEGVDKPCIPPPDDLPAPPWGRAAAQVMLGDLYYIAGERDQALEWWLRAADHKDFLNKNDGKTAAARMELLERSHRPVAP